MLKFLYDYVFKNIKSIELLKLLFIKELCIINLYKIQKYFITTLKKI